MNYYNKGPEATEINDIDFESWRGEILTENLVDTVEKNHAALMEENYNVAAVANDVLSAPSQEYSDIQQELTYQFTLWSNYYASQQMDLVKLEAVGN